MIICRTPLRVSLFGGGLDYPEWFNKKNTTIINFALNKYTYILVREIKKIHKYNYRLRYHETEEVKNVNQIKHGPYREILKLLKLEKTPLEIIYTADLPALSGLGSSSSSTVGMTNACHALSSKYIAKRNLAQFAINIERNILKEDVGYQDQVCSSFGGLNFIELNRSGFAVNPIFNHNIVKKINENFYILYTGIQREAKYIEKKKIKNIKKNKKLDLLLKSHELSEEATSLFKNNKIELKLLGQLINKSWSLKKQITPEVSNPRIDKKISTVLKSGAYGAKLVGSGNGGFILYLADKKTQKKISSIIDNRNNIIKCGIDFSGSQIIYNGTFNNKL